MSTYEYIDNDRDTLRVEGVLDAGDTYVAVVPKSGSGYSVRIPKADVPTVAAELLKAAGQESVIVAKAYEEVERLGYELTCGGGPEWVGASIAENPNWLRNKAANCIAIAEYIENKEQREAEAEKKLQERRDALARKFAEGIAGARTDYAGLPTTQRLAINYIIDLEDGK